MVKPDEIKSSTMIRPDTKNLIKPNEPVVIPPKEDEKVPVNPQKEQAPNTGAKPSV